MKNRKFIYLSLFFIVSLLILFWVASSRNNIRINNQIESLLLNRQFQEARNTINNLLKSNPKNADALFSLARLELAEDHAEAAIQAIEKAESQKYNPRSIEILRGLAFARGGNYAEAQKILVPAFLNGEEPRAEIAEGLTRVYLAQFQATQARKAIEAWKEASPRDDRPYLYLNEIEDRSGTEAAVRIANYLAAIDRNPGLFETHEKLANLYLEDNQLENAKAEFQKCLEMKPGNQSSLIGMGQTLLKQGNQPEAEKVLYDVLKNDPGQIFALAELSQIELQKGNVETAVAQLKKAFEQSPYSSELVYKYAQALKLAGNVDLSRQMVDRSNRLKTEEARMDEIRKLLVKEPNNIEVRMEAAIWLIDHGHEKEGLQWADLVLKQRPGDPKLCTFLTTYFEQKKDFGLANYYRSIIKK